MPKLTIIEFSGKEHHLEPAIGASVMRVALDAAVPGILADCGGSCSCATCHCYVDEAWVESLPPPDALEREMLECVVDHQVGSRLSCQIRISEETDGMVLRFPRSQI